MNQEIRKLSRKELLAFYYSHHSGNSEEAEMTLTLLCENGKWFVRQVENGDKKKRVINTYTDEVAKIVFYFIEKHFNQTGEIRWDYCGAQEGSLAWFVIKYFERLVNKQPHSKTIEKYKSCCYHILGYFGGNYQVSELTPEKWEEYQRVRQTTPHDRGNGYSGMSLENERIVMNGIMDQAIKSGEVNKNLIKGAAQPVHRQMIKTHISIEEMQRLWQIPYWGNYWRIWAHLGLRIHEFTSLRQEDIDLDRMVVRVVFRDDPDHTIKTDEEREVDIPPPIQNLIRVVKFPVCYENGKKIGDNRLADHFRKHCKELGIRLAPRNATHCFRRYFINFCYYELGLDIRFISKLAGAKIETLSDHYIQDSPEARKRAVMEKWSKYQGNTLPAVA